MRADPIETFLWSLVADAMRQHNEAWLRSGMGADAAYLYAKPSNGAVPGELAVLLEGEVIPEGFVLLEGGRLGFGLSYDAAKSKIRQSLQRAPVLAS